MSRVIRRTKLSTMSWLVYWISVILVLIPFVGNILLPLYMAATAISTKQVLPLLIAILFVIIWLAVSFAFLFVAYLAAFENNPPASLIVLTYLTTGSIFFVVLKIIQSKIL